MGGGGRWGCGGGAGKFPSLLNSAYIFTRCFPACKKKSGLAQAVGSWTSGVGNLAARV